ncbi:hypothetical protein EYF80_033131 [Liparis tanakae]|uniref:Uncharacterized protein n=1 Tax=Liparis tanakae TaxID=230148 RepID=A0A4Z2GVF4_9TELE|nr:hypothetical protein EYF80_033131 [Liparis tanakae]
MPLYTESSSLSFTCVTVSQFSTLTGTSVPTSPSGGMHIRAEGEELNEEDVTLRKRCSRKVNQLVSIFSATDSVLNIHRSKVTHKATHVLKRSASSCFRTTVAYSIRP